jgi:hypothetical protein
MGGFMETGMNHPIVMGLYRPPESRAMHTPICSGYRLSMAMLNGTVFCIGGLRGYAGQVIFPTRRMFITIP